MNFLMIKKSEEVVEGFAALLGKAFETLPNYLVEGDISEVGFHYLIYSFPLLSFYINIVRLNRIQQRCLQLTSRELAQIPKREIYLVNWRVLGIGK